MSNVSIMRSIIDEMEMPNKDAFPDQRSVTDQLIDLIQIANRYKLYDAADWIKRGLEK